MNQPSIRTSPSDSPKFNFLLRRNYLGEYKTEIDKARVRKNLGIPDEFSMKWGNIEGLIEQQSDLMQIINRLERRIKALEDSNASVSTVVYYGSSVTTPLDVTQGASRSLTSNTGEISFFASNKCAWIALPIGWTLNSWEETTLGMSYLENNQVKTKTLNGYILYYVLSTDSLNTTFIIKFNK